jgi:dipeptide/tripeptide permease
LYVPFLFFFSLYVISGISQYFSIPTYAPVPCTNSMLQHQVMNSKRRKVRLFCCIMIFRVVFWLVGAYAHAMNSKIVKILNFKKKTDSIHVCNSHVLVKLYG